MSAPSTQSVTFTVFTPTFNRSHTLERVYRSLCSQTLGDFEWLVIDDGSTDDTATVIKEWQASAPFQVRYVLQENQGKHIAFNRALKAARGRFFVPLDSDDACVPHALQRFLECWNSIPETVRSEFAGVTCRCVDQNGHLVGEPFPFQQLDSNAREIYYRYGITAELWGAGVTEILRRYALDEREKRTYIPEGTLWFLIARSYKARYISDALRIYYLEGPSITRQQLPSRHAYGARLENLIRLRDDLSYFSAAPIQFLRFAALYSRFSFHLRIGLRKQLQELPNIGSAVLYGLGLPLGVLAYVRDRAVERRTRKRPNQVPPS
jgi:glycosyltransferase involved in cell wall biosynthesis